MRQPVLTNPQHLSETERERRGIRRLPIALDAALDALEQDAVLLDSLGPLLSESYLAVKRSEALFYREKPAQDVAALHRFKY
jgi:glutamine synthetase